MTQLFNDVKITGVADVSQLTILANATQVTNPIQVWQDSAGNPLLRVSGDGRLQIGNNIALGSADALINANYTPSGALPTSVWHATGVLNVPTSLSGTVNWVDHELQLTGAGTVNGVQSALYTKLTNSTTGNAGTADLRAATFQAISSGGSSAVPVGKVTGIRAIASNAVTGGSAYLSQAIGVETTISNDAGGSITAATAFSVAAPSNNGSIGTVYGLKILDLTQGSANYALYTGQGIVHVGDVLETPVLASTPTSTPPANFVQLYTKLLAGAPQLHAKNSSGTEYLVGGGGGGGAPTTSKYLLQVADGALPNAQAMGALNTGLVKNTTTTGVQSIAVSGTDYTTPTGSENLSNKTISASTLNNSVIGGTAPAAGHFSTLQVGTSATSGNVLTADASGNATWQAAAAGGSHTPSFLTRSANYSSTSTSFVDIDGTNLIITKTTSSPNIMVFCAGTFGCTSVFYMNLIMDSTTYATNAHATYGLLQGYGGNVNGPMVGYFTGVSAGSHTFKPRWLSSVGTGYPVYNSGGGAFQQTIYMAVMEL